MFPRNNFAFQQTAQQRGLADAGFARYVNGRAPALLDRLPCVVQRREFLLATYQQHTVIRQIRQVGQALDFEYLDQSVDAGQLLLAKACEFDAGADQAMRGFADDNHVGFSEPLQAGRYVRNLAQRERFLARFCAHVADDDLAGMNTDAHLELCFEFRFDLAVQIGHPGNDIEARPNRANSIGLVDARVAEVGKNAVTEILRHVTIRLDDRV